MECGWSWRGFEGEMEGSRIQRRNFCVKVKLLGWVDSSKGLMITAVEFAVLVSSGELAKKN